MSKKEIVTLQGVTLDAGGISAVARQYCQGLERLLGNRAAKIELETITLTYRCESEHDKYSGLVPSDVRDWHAQDATGVPDEMLSFTEDNPLEDDWDPQF